MTCQGGCGQGLWVGKEEVHALPGTVPTPGRHAGPLQVPARSSLLPHFEGRGCLLVGAAVPSNAAVAMGTAARAVCS